MLDQAEPLNLWLYVRSLAESKRFYGEKLGLPLLREEPGEALHFAAGGTVLTLRVGAPTDLPPRGTRVMLAVASDPDELCDELRARGVAFEAPLVDRPFGRSAMFHDPDGHELWICRPAPTEAQFPRWRESRRRQTRRVVVQRRPTVRRHEPARRAMRDRHPE